MSINLKNRKAFRDYVFLEELECGIVLTGSEVKAIRGGKVDFLGSYVKIVGGELYLINLHIGVGGLADSRRTRKLLMNKREIITIGVKLKQQKLTLIPVKLYNKDRLFKLKVALARSKKSQEKRAQLKARDIERDIERELKEM